MTFEDSGRTTAQSQSGEAAHSADPRSGERRWVTALVGLSAVVMTLDISIVNVALPDIAADFGSGLEAAQWIINAYVLAFAALLLTVGAASDRLGRRRIFLVGHVIFAVGSLLCALAPTDAILIGGRGVQGIGAALVFGTCLALLSDAYGDDSAGRVRAVGVFMACGAGAVALGPLVGGLLVELGGWRWIFAINLPIGVGVIIATLATMNLADKTVGSSRVDPVSTVLITTLFFAANFALLSGPDHGWTSPRVLLCAVVTVIVGVAAFWRQRALGDDAMVDLSLFRIPTFSAVIFISFAIRVFSFGVFPFLIFWFSGANGLSPVQTGAVLLFLAIPMIIAAGPSVALARVVSLARVLALSMSTVAAGLIWAAVVAGPDASWTALIGPLVLIGIGSGLSMPHIMDIAMAVAPARLAGTATGVANTAFPLGTAAGIAVFGALIHGRVDAASALPEPARPLAYVAEFDRLAPLGESAVDAARSAYGSGLTTMFIVAAAVAAVAAVVALTSVRTNDFRA
ncbi:MFS transporter [Gordonia hydrophobica]|uniref:MFS transporter n=1 Tax=Gordonia hydrophobica TaxID=40516 RepID=A0ABZ2U663_9ACTN|nr:MFS transporter [Gordonia hydrophobica]MBM7367313.1 EmrB/QacA subfamily drug resistance transporter [Gordonia hydrophobica]